MKIIIVFFLLPLMVFAQKKKDKQSVSKEVVAIAKKIAKEDIVAGSAVGYSGKRTEQYSNFEKLKDIATSAELITLTDHASGVVRSYAFWALCEKQDKSIVDIIKNHLEDYKVIKTFFGCIMSDQMVGDFFIYSARSYNENEISAIDSIQLNDIYKRLIATDSKLIHKEYAISEIPATEENYKLIKLFAVEKKNLIALVKLSEFKKEEDVTIFNNYYKSITGDDYDNFYHFYLIADNYPHPYFFPFLKTELEKTMDNDHYNGNWNLLYKAIAAYHNDEAFTLLKKPFTDVIHSQIKKYHLKYVEDAITKHPDKLYDELLWKLWQENNIITINTYEHLSYLDSLRAYNLSLASLSLNHNPNDEFEYIPEDLTELLIKEIYKKDKIKANEIILNRIEHCNVHELSIFTQYAKDNHNSIYTSALFNRLKTDENPHIYLEIISTLISYNNSDFNDQIIEIRKERKYMNEGWGSNALDKLLEDKDIH